MLWSSRTCQLLRLGRKAERPVKPNIKIKKATSTLFKKRLEFPELPQTDEIIRTKTTHTRRERSISRLRYQLTDNSRIKNDLHRCRAFVFKAVKLWCNTHKTYHSTQATFPPPPPGWNGGEGTASVSLLEEECSATSGLDMPRKYAELVCPVKWWLP